MLCENTFIDLLLFSNKHNYSMLHHVRSNVDEVIFVVVTGISLSEIWENDVYGIQLRLGIDYAYIEFMSTCIACCLKEHCDRALIFSNWFLSILQTTLSVSRKTESGTT